MKKLLYLFLATLMLTALAGCGGGEIEIPTDVDFAACLVTEDVDGTLTVTGTTELGRAQQVIVIPATVDGKPLKAIAEGAFDGCQKLQHIYIDADSSISYLNSGAFKGAISLSRIILGKKPTEITVSKDVLEGAASTAKFYVPAAYYGDYTTNYQWGVFASKTVKQQAAE